MLNLDKNKRYLLGCSYGPDSMALFYLMEKEGYDFDVAIVNYHLRIESDDEVEGLKNYCKKHNKKIHIFDVKEIPHRNIEENCRKIRYEFFGELIRKYNYYGLVVAHHKDDLLETYLMQKQRQICPIFYGMKEKSHIFGIDVYRPLLDKTKNELKQICDSNSVPYMIDKSNQNTIFLRNKIRHEIVSKLSDKEKDNLLSQINEENRKLEELLANISLNKLKKVDYLLSLDDMSFLYAVNMLKNQSGKYDDLSRKQCFEILKILKSNKPNIETKINGKLRFRKEYDEVGFYSSENNVMYSYIINKPCILDTPYFYLDFTKDASNRNIDKNDYPLTIRNIKPDDQYQIKNYLTLARRLLIDWKVPMSLRKRWPVILSKTGKIIYIPRYQKDFKKTKDINFIVKLK